MLYRQGLGIPGHPGHNGSRPLTGIEDDLLEDLWNVKLNFAGGKIKTAEELMDFIPLGDDVSTPPGGVGVKRIAPNVFEFSHMQESVLSSRPGSFIT